MSIVTTLEEAKKLKYGLCFNEDFVEGRCVTTIKAKDKGESISYLLRQCSKNSGHGPGGLYCCKHAKMPSEKVQQSFETWFYVSDLDGHISEANNIILKGIGIEVMSEYIPRPSARNYFKTKEEAKKRSVEIMTDLVRHNNSLIELLKEYNDSFIKKIDAANAVSEEDFRIEKDEWPID